MAQKFKFIAMAIILFSFVENLFGQSNFTGFSISPKLGVYSTINADQIGIMAGAEANVMSNRFLYSVNYYYGDEWIIVGSGPDRHFNQTAFMFGRYKPYNSFRMDYQAGIAALWGIRYTEYHPEGFLEGYHDTEDFTKLGLVMEFGGELVPSKYFSMGAHLNLNLNTEIPMVGIVLDFSFGLLKD